MLSFFNHLSQSWLDGAVRALEGWRRGVSEPFPLTDDPPPTTPYEVVYEGGKARLRHYRAEARRLSTPLLLVYSLIKRPFILDLQPGRSVIEALTKQGIEVYLIDWVPPTRADRWRGFAAYVHDLANAVRAVQLREGVEQVSLLGYCMGGLLTTMYAALYPRPVKTLVSLTLPLDLSNRAIPVYNLLDALSSQTAKLLTDIYGNCPAWFIKMGFEAMAPMHHAVDKYVHLYRNREHAGYAEMFDLFERWMNSDVPLAGQIFHETLDNLFRQKTLIQGCFALDGRRVDLKQITAPVLNIVAEHDDVVHPSSSLPFTDLVGSKDAHTLLFPTGHIGVAVSSASQKTLWPRVGAWLKERDGRWTH